MGADMCLTEALGSASLWLEGLLESSTLLGGSGALISGGISPPNSLKKIWVTIIATLLTTLVPMSLQVDPLTPKPQTFDPRL